MLKFKKFAITTLALISLGQITSCGSYTNTTTSNQFELKAGVTLSHQPVDSADLIRLRDQELIPLVEKGKISAEEARTFMRAQKKRLNMPNQNKTEALDKILRKKGL